MVGVGPVLYVGWKLYHKTRIYKPEEVDLHKDLNTLEEYERNYVPQPPKYVSRCIHPLWNTADPNSRNFFEKALDKIFG